MKYWKLFPTKATINTPGTPEPWELPKNFYLWDKNNIDWKLNDRLYQNDLFLSFVFIFLAKKQCVLNVLKKKIKKRGITKHGKIWIAFIVCSKCLNLCQKKITHFQIWILINIQSFSLFNDSYNEYKPCSNFRAIKDVTFSIWMNMINLPFNWIVTFMPCYRNRDRSWTALNSISVCLNDTWQLFSLVMIFVFHTFVNPCVQCVHSLINGRNVMFLLMKYHKINYAKYKCINRSYIIYIILYCLFKKLGRGT